MNKKRPELPIEILVDRVIGLAELLTQPSQVTTPPTPTKPSSNPKQQDTDTKVDPENTRPTF